MVQQGHFLEIMMANLQSYLGPEGIDVKLREKFYNPESGRLIGEIDITVRGEFGTSKFFFGIECRDRPANGTQGLPWIREIVGKKRQLKPDKMIAVSSTGFTADAQQFADEESIDLITIADPTDGVLKEWFKILDVSYTDWRIAVTRPLTLNLVDRTREGPAAEMLNNVRGGDPVFIMPPFDMRPRSFESLVCTMVQSQLPQFNGPVQGMYIEISSPLSIILGGQVYPLRNAVTEIDIVPHTDVVRALLNVCHRLGDNRVIAMTGRAEVTIKGKQMIFFVIVKKDNNTNGTMSMRAHFYDSAGNTTTLPEGVVMEMAVE